MKLKGFQGEGDSHPAPTPQHCIFVLGSSQTLTSPPQHGTQPTYGHDVIAVLFMELNPGLGLAVLATGQDSIAAGTG